MKIDGREIGKSLNILQERADLHLHTKASDGIYTPAEVVQKAVQNNISAIAITDHDTTEGIKEAVLEGVVQGIQVYPGIELSVSFQPIMHILGLFIDIENDRLKKHIARVNRLRKSLIVKGFKQVSKYGIIVTPAQVIANKQILSLKSLVEYLVENNFVANRKEIDTIIKDIWQEWYINLPDIKETIELIHECNGIAVLAHAKTLNLDDINLEMTLTKLKQYGLDGIEIYHPKHTLLDRQKYKLYAERIGLLYSGGSDFHGNEEANTMASGENSIEFSDFLKLKEKCRKGIYESKSRGF